MIEYACTKAVKEVVSDNFGRRRQSGYRPTFNERLNITACDLEGLLKSIASHYALDIKEVIIPGTINGEDELTKIQYHRFENESSSPVDSDYLSRWSKGEVKVWNARYTFTIEIRDIKRISWEDIKSAMKIF